LCISYISTSLQGGISGRPNCKPVLRHSVSPHLGTHLTPSQSHSRCHFPAVTISQSPSRSPFFVVTLRRQSPPSLSVVTLHRHSPLSLFAVLLSQPLANPSLSAVICRVNPVYITPFFQSFQGFFRSYNCNRITSFLMAASSSLILIVHIILIYFNHLYGLYPRRHCSAASSASL
jgi:hypothetical protein